MDLKWIIDFRSRPDKPKGFSNEVIAVDFVRTLQKSGNIGRAAKKVKISTMSARSFITELREAANKGMGLREYIRKGRPFRTGAEVLGKHR